MDVRAVHKWVRRSPMKVRRYCRLVQGKPVKEAIELLELETSPSAFEVLRAIKSAVANAENNYALDADDLYVKKCVADDAMRLKRIWPRGRGRADIILRRTCHITVVVSDGQEEQEEPEEAEAASG